MFHPPTFLHRDTPEVPTPLLEATPSLVVTLASFCGAYLPGSACACCVVVVKHSFLYVVSRFFGGGGVVLGFFGFGLVPFCLQQNIE